MSMLTQDIQLKKIAYRFKNLLACKHIKGHASDALHNKTQNNHGEITVVCHSPSIPHLVFHDVIQYLCQCSLAGPHPITLMQRMTNNLCNFCKAAGLINLTQICLLSYCLWHTKNWKMTTLKQCPFLYWVYSLQITTLDTMHCLKCSKAIFQGTVAALLPLLALSVPYQRKDKIHEALQCVSEADGQL